MSPSPAASVRGLDEPDRGARAAPGANASDPGQHASGGRPKRAYLIVALLVAGALAVAIPAGVHLKLRHDAGLEYDIALTKRAEAIDAHSAARHDLLDAVTASKLDLGLASSLRDNAPPAWVGEEEHLSLSAAIDDLVGLLDNVSAVRNPLPPISLSGKPDELQDLLDEIVVLEDDTRLRESNTREQQAMAGSITSQASEVVASAAALVEGIPARAESFNASNSSATNSAYRNFVGAKVGVESQVGSWNQSVADAADEYFAAASELQASHVAEEAEKSGPLYAKRVVVEQFARSIAGGVRLDFNWAPVVNGHGYGGTYGGTANWDSADTGYSTISLSNSVAALWGSHAGVVSLVAHEVGHAITSKCYDLYSTHFGSQDETWATAWAVGMGYNADGNGVSLYGRPSGDLIALSIGCR